MKVTLRQHGGLAAGIARAPAMVDSASLPPAAKAELDRLVATERGKPASSLAAPGRARDAMSYAITIERDEETIVLRQSDVDMSPEFAALLDWLRRRTSVP